MLKTSAHAAGLKARKEMNKAPCLNQSCIVRDLKREKQHIMDHVLGKEDHITIYLGMIKVSVDVLLLGKDLYIF